jgi:two-component system, OmpR family, alkaline phosphatase synthesis response regulator PhoP
MTKKILVVDDEADLLLVTMLRLKHAGYESFGAATGPEALDQARQKMPDLILLDAFLPVMNGDEVTRILKKEEKTKNIPVILISADPKFLEEKFAACGADGRLAKPFKSAELLALIKKHIG